LRDLSSELGGSGSLKVQGDEAARLLVQAVNENGRGTCATVPGGFLFFRLQAVRLGAKVGKRENLLSIGSSFPFAQKVFPESWKNPQPQKLPTARQQRIHLPGP
jgi:hypothetical protein